MLISDCRRSRGIRSSVPSSKNIIGLVLGAQHRRWTRGYCDDGICVRVLVCGTGGAFVFRLRCSKNLEDPVVIDNRKTADRILVKRRCSHSWSRIIINLPHLSSPQ